jgi:tetraacyldisaccharide 4'-kinase
VNTEHRQAEYYQVRYDGILEKLFSLILAEERRSVGLGILRVLASLLAWFYGGLVSLRNRLFEIGIIKTHEFGCRVISVGNLTTGGTGKTPMVLWLARFLLEEGRRVAIVSRGYRSEDAGRVLVVSDGQKILVDSRMSGDEPQLLARRLPEIPVVCSPKRVLAVQTAIKKFQSEVIILDDGFQHRFLARDVDLVMLDSQNPFGNGRLFPRGILREQTTALARAQAIVLSRFDGSDKAEENLTTLSRQWSDKPVLTTSHRPARLFEAVTQQERSLDSLQEVPLAAFAGIGRPNDFFRSVRDLGARLVYACSLPDHHPLSTELLTELERDAAELEPELWLTTEKDWVRLPRVLPNNMALWVMTVELDIRDEGSRLKSLIRKSLAAAT